MRITPPNGRAYIDEQIDELDTLGAKYPLGSDGDNPGTTLITADGLENLEAVIAPAAVLDDDVAETSLLAVPWDVDANFLDTGDRVRMAIHGPRTDNRSGGGTTTFRVRVGSVAGGITNMTSLGNVVLPALQSGTTRSWRWDASGLVVLSGSDKVIEWSGLISEANPTSTTTAFTRPHHSTSAAINLSVAREWVVTAIHSHADPLLAVAAVRAYFYVTKARS